MTSGCCAAEGYCALKENLRLDSDPNLLRPKDLVGTIPNAARLQGFPALTPSRY